jgi:hypothetical protein
MMYSVPVHAASGGLLALIALSSVLDHPDAASAPIMVFAIDPRSGVYTRNGGKTDGQHHQTRKRRVRCKDTTTSC